MHSEKRARHRTHLSRVVRRNVRAMIRAREDLEKDRTWADRLATRVTGFSGTPTFVAIHAALFGGWLLYNSGLFDVPRFDPFPFVMLAMFASVEAIFLATFVLITQNRMQRAADQRADLHLQIALLTEHELTRAIDLLDHVAGKLGAGAEVDRQAIESLKAEVTPGGVLREIERVEEDVSSRARGAARSTASSPGAGR